MKKRMIAILLLTVLTCTALLACGGKKDLSQSKYLGTWKVASMTLLGESEAPDEEIILVLNPDGTATLATGGEVSNCTWDETNSGIKLKGDAKLTFTEKDGGLTAKVIGVEMLFEKQ